MLTPSERIEQLATANKYDMSLKHSCSMWKAVRLLALIVMFVVFMELLGKSILCQQGQDLFILCCFNVMSNPEVFIFSTELSVFYVRGSISIQLHS